MAYSKLVLEPDIDDGASRDAQKQLKEELGEAGENAASGITERINQKFGSREMGANAGQQIGSVFGGGAVSGEAMAGEKAGGALGSAAEAGGMAGAAAGMGVAALVGIAGAVKQLADASPTFGKMLSILDTANQMFFRPFGRALGSTLMPFAKKNLAMATKFNKMASQKGLRVAITEMLFGNPFKIITSALGILSGGVAGASVGALVGAIVGTIAGPVGTAAGAAAGAKIGAVLGAVAGPFWAQSSKTLKSIARGVLNIPKRIMSGFKRVGRMLQGVVSTIPGVDSPGGISGGGGGTQAAGGDTVSLGGDDGNDNEGLLDRMDELINTVENQDTVELFTDDSDRRYVLE